jgi:hypothetical protein
MLRVKQQYTVVDRFAVSEAFKSDLMGGPCKFLSELDLCGTGRRGLFFWLLGGKNGTKVHGGAMIGVRFW